MLSIHSRISRIYKYVETLKYTWNKETEAMMQTEIDGEWISVERGVTDEVGQDIISMAVSTADDDGNRVSLSVTGDESSYTGTLSESQIPDYIELVTQEEVDEDTNDGALPEGFFDRLTTRQRAFLEIILDRDEPVTGPDIRDEMRTEYDIDVADSGSGTAGIISGFTRKYGKEFRGDLIGGTVSHHNDEGSRVFEHWIEDKYEDELRDYFDMEDTADTK